MTTKYLSVQDVAQILQVNKITVYGWIKKGKIPFLKINGSLRFDPNTIENWINGNRVV